jgi:DNA-binding NarL/FixJ family response regulator
MSNTLLIAEYSEVIRKGLVHIIGGLDLFDRILEADGDSGIEMLVKNAEPDVIIINPGLITPGLRKLAGRLKNGHVSIAALTNAGNGGVVPKNTETGVDFPIKFSEIFSVNDTAAEIREKIENLAGEPSSQEPEYTGSILSPREKEVVRLLARGLNNKEISEQLFISPHTVTTHRKNITRKLNIKSVAGLLVYALINEIITVDEMQRE